MRLEQFTDKKLEEQAKLDFLYKNIRKIVKHESSNVAISVLSRVIAERCISLYESEMENKYEVIKLTDALFEIIKKKVKEGSTEEVSVKI